MVIRAGTFSVSAFARIAASDILWFSTKSTATAPRDSASNPRAPDPANRSSTRASGIDCCRMLNQASRTRSDVGRTVRPLGTFRRRPLNSPATIRSTANAKLGIRNAELQWKRYGANDFSLTFRIPNFAFRISFRRRQTCDPSLNRRPSLPVIPLQPKGDVERVREPVLRHRIRPAKADRRKQTRAVVEREPQVIRSDAARADRSRVPHAEHRRRIPRPA